jgi:hypothetical protein
VRQFDDLRAVSEDHRGFVDHDRAPAILNRSAEGCVQIARTPNLDEVDAHAPGPGGGLDDAPLRQMDLG